MLKTITINRPLVLVEQRTPSGELTCASGPDKETTCAALEAFKFGFAYRCSLTGKQVYHHDGGYGYMEPTAGCPWLEADE